MRSIVGLYGCARTSTIASKYGDAGRPREKSSRRDAECRHTSETHLMPLDPSLAPVPHLLEVSHVAHRLSASQEYVRSLIRKRKLAAIRLGTRWRVDPVDLQAFIDRQRIASEKGA